VKNYNVLERHCFFCRLGEIRNAYKILVRKTEGREHAKDLGVDRKIILEGEVAMLNKAPDNEDGWGSGGIAPRILDLGIRWR
jgi:hypothetical protein